MVPQTYLSGKEASAIYHDFHESLHINWPKILNTTVGQRPINPIMVCKSWSSLVPSF